MDKKIEIVLYSESRNFASLLTSTLDESSPYAITDVIESVSELRNYSFNETNPLIIVCASKVSKMTIDAIFDIFEKRNIHAISVCDDPTTNFFMMKKGVLGTVILRENSSTSEVMLFFKSLETKVLDADRLKHVVTGRSLKREVKLKTKKLIVMGSSTGGTDAVLKVLKALPAEVPPILIVQHMPEVFTRMYADRLNSTCNMTVWEAKDGEELKPGLALVAPGNNQMRLVKGLDGFNISCKQIGKVNGHEPSVDVLFDSISEIYDCKEVIAVLMTGMGSDGARGLYRLRQNGAYTIGQDEASSVVYGMPKIAYDAGAVLEQAHIDDIAKLILEKI